MADTLEEMLQQEQSHILGALGEMPAEGPGLALQWGQFQTFNLQPSGATESGSEGFSPPFY